MYAPVVRTRLYRRPSLTTLEFTALGWRVSVSAASHLLRGQVSRGAGNTLRVRCSDLTGPAGSIGFLTDFFPKALILMHTFRSLAGSSPVSSYGAARVEPCGSSACLGHAGRSSGRSLPRLDASACAGSSVTPRSARTRPCSCAERERSTRSACDFRSAPCCSTGRSWSGPSSYYGRAGSSSRDLVSAISSNARRGPTYGPVTSSVSSRAPERPRQAAAILPGAAPGPGAGCGMTGPPSSSGLGFRPFKAATRVRIPLGAHNRIAHTRP